MSIDIEQRDETFSRESLYENMKVCQIGNINFLVFSVSRIGYNYDFLLNTNSIKAVKNFYDKDNKEFIELIIDEKVKSFIYDFIEIGYEYDSISKTLKLRFYVCTLIGQKLHNYFINNI